MASVSTRSAAREEGGDASEKAQEAVTTIQEKAQETAVELKDQASGRIRTEIDTRTTQISEQLVSINEALRKGAEHLQAEGKQTGAQAAHRAADETERLARYLRRVNSDTLVDDLERAARSKPWLVTGLSAVAGFVSSRFLKASAERRAESRASRPGATRSLPPAPRLDAVEER